MALTRRRKIILMRALDRGEKLGESGRILSAQAKSLSISSLRAFFPACLAAAMVSK